MRGRAERPPFAAVAIILGFDYIRIGMEDLGYMYPHRDERIDRNADMVRKVADVARALGREIATPREAREFGPCPPEAGRHTADCGSRHSHLGLLCSISTEMERAFYLRESIMRFCVIGLIIATGLSLGAGYADSVDVGVVAAMGRAPEFIAFEKGYFRDVGLDVHLIEIDLSSDSAAANANGSLPIIGGAISVGFFNSIAKGFPVRIMLEAGSTPIGAKLMIRPDLRREMHSLADLKGRTVNLVAPGSSIVYVTGRMLETVGLSLRDVETKYLPFSQVAPAFANKAIDAAVLIQPTVATIEAAGLAVPWIDPDDVIRPTPMFISGTIVTRIGSSANRTRRGASFMRSCAVSVTIALPITAAAIEER